MSSEEISNFLFQVFINDQLIFWYCFVIVVIKSTFGKDWLWLWKRIEESSHAFPCAFLLPHKRQQTTFFFLILSHFTFDHIEKCFLQLKNWKETFFKKWNHNNIVDAEQDCYHELRQLVHVNTPFILNISLHMNTTFPFHACTCPCKPSNFTYTLLSACLSACVRAHSCEYSLIWLLLRKLESINSWTFNSIQLKMKQSIDQTKVLHLEMQAKRKNTNFLQHNC